MIVSTSYFPSCAWLVAVAGGAQVEAHENFQKQTPRNRCTILSANGPLTLVVPYIHSGGRKIAIRDVQIDHSTPWQRTHRRAIEAAYRSSPFWEHFEGKILPLLELKEQFLWDLNEQIAQTLLGMLKIETTIAHTQTFVGAQELPPIQTPYVQVFADRHPFIPGLSALDSILCQAQLPTAE